MAREVLSLGGGRRPAPKHALDEHVAPGRRRERSTLMLLILLVLSSGFVVGTTATFNASTKNANNTFATMALDSPSNIGVTGTGTAEVVNWDRPSTNAGTGYLMTFKDSGAAISNLGVTTSCDATGTYSNVASVAHNAATTTHTWTDTSVTTRANYADGRVYCYQVQSAYPYLTSPATTIPSTAWLSQVNNPIASAVVGLTLINGNGTYSTSVTGNGDRKLTAGDKFTFVFNQPIQTATAPTNSQTICANGKKVTSAAAVDASIFIGMSNTNNNACAPSTETLSGFQISLSTDPTSFQLVRYAETITWGTTCGASPTTCDVMIVTVGAQKGSNTWQMATGTTMSIRGTANGTNLVSAGNTTRAYCASGTATNVVANATVEKYRADPATGRCIISGLSHTL